MGPRRGHVPAGTAKLEDCLRKTGGVPYKVIKEADAEKEMGFELEIPGDYWQPGTARIDPIATCSTFLHAPLFTPRRLLVLRLVLPRRLKIRMFMFGLMLMLW